jgi:hypothetical protein
MFSHSELVGKSCADMHDMMFARGTNWNDLQTSVKRGRCIVRVKAGIDGVVRSRWVVDNETPVFSSDRLYIDKHLSHVDQ